MGRGGASVRPNERRPVQRILSALRVPMYLTDTREGVSIYDTVAGATCGGEGSPEIAVRQALVEEAMRKWNR